MATLAVLGDVLKKLSTVEPAHVAIVTFDGNFSSKPSAKWSLLNKLIMEANGTSDARGFNQWKTVGRYVKKGAKAFYIIGPCTKKVTKKDPVTGEETSEVVITGFRGIPVFRYEDTEGKPLPEEEQVPSEIKVTFSGIIQELGLNVRTTEFNGSTYGLFRPGTHEIELASPELQIFLHELAHAVDHRVNKPLKGGQHVDQEVVAEFSAAVIAHLLGKEIKWELSRKYIEGYGGDLKAVTAYFSRVEKIVSFIMSRIGAGQPAPITDGWRS